MRLALQPSCSNVRRTEAPRRFHMLQEGVPSLSNPNFGAHVMITLCGTLAMDLVDSEVVEPHEAEKVTCWRCLERMER